MRGVTSLAVDHKGRSLEDRIEALEGLSACLPSRPWSSVSVLVVEDDVVDYKLTKRLLKGIDAFEIDLAHAESLTSARKLIATMKFDIVIVDLYLGAESGIDILRELGGRASEAVLILMTGNNSPDIHESAFRAGAVGFLNKDDVSSRTLESTLRLAMHTHELETKLLKALVDLNRADRVKADFIARVSQDLKIPLHTIIGNVAAICSNPPTGSQSDTQEKVVEIGENANRLLNSIENMIMHSLDGQSNTSHNYQMHDIGEVFEEAIGLVQASFQKKGQTLDIKATGQPLHAMVDRAEIRQAFLNILLNANQFTGPDSEISATLYDLPRKIIFEVTDTGAGMTREAIAAALEPFGRTNPDSQDGGGTGLGLPIVRDIMSRHGGRLDIDSCPGKGTTMKIVLPKDDKYATLPRNRRPLSGNTH